ncbi:MAG TPA: hypothetical protein VK419_05390 [Bryobacteraceae bacterium]|nr:hypothetical protein [Bryobacteraceae bacterium]
MTIESRCSHLEDRRNWSTVRLFWIIFCLGLIIRGALVFGKPDYKLNFQPEAVKVAVSLAERGQFADPYNEPTGPSAAVSPLYPFFLSVLIWLFGSGVAGSLAVSLLTCVLSSLQYPLLIFLPAQLEIPRRVCVGAALLGAVTPFQLEPELHGHFENTLAACVLIGLTLLTAAWLRGGTRRTATGIVTGLGWGLAVQLSPSLLPVLVFWICYGFFSRAKPEKSVKQYLWSAAVVSSMVVLIAVPWTVRNYIRLGSAVWSRDNFGLDLHMSYDDCASPTVLQNMQTGCFYSRHPNGNAQELLEIRQRGEIEYNREKFSQAMEWINAHPQRFLSLTVGHALRFWFVDFDTSHERRLAQIFTGYYWMLTLLGFVGLAAMLRRRYVAGWMFACVLAAYPLIYYLHEASVRYRYPIYWVTEVLAVYAVFLCLPTFQTANSKTGKTGDSPHVFSIPT